MIPYYLHRRAKAKGKIGFNWEYISIPLILNGCSLAPELPTNVILSGFIASLAVYFFKNANRKVFESYGGILSAALDAGTSVNSLVIYSLGLSFISWWGNDAVDSEHCKIVI